MARILVVDDDPAVLAAVKTLLEMEGHGVTTAGDGSEGFRRLGSDHFDLLIVDVFMPGTDGLETIRLVHRRYPTLPIIVMSGFTFRSSSAPAPDFLAMATKLGGARSLQKPFKPRELMTIIDECLAQQSGESDTDGEQRRPRRDTAGGR
jgi:CheY-like chemotaxis protein